MNSSDYRKWMERAFLYVEAALATELASPSQICMTEDYLRASLVRGLAHSKPSQADRIDTEFDAPWGGRSCWKPCGEQPPGRAIQHDVAVSPNDDDEGMVCEVKWLKSANAPAVARDIWKLALTRTTSSEGSATRCYMLLGGEADPLSATLRTLREHGVDLRWSNAGGQGNARASRDLLLSKFLTSQLGSKALEYQLTWGSKHVHMREPVDCWRALRVTRRCNPWVRTVDNIGWRAVLFEFHHHGAADDEILDVSAFKAAFAFTC